MELNNTIIELRNSLEGLNIELIKQKKVSVNSKTSHWKLFSQRSKKKKIKKSKESLRDL